MHNINKVAVAADKIGIHLQKAFATPGRDFYCRMHFFFCADTPLLLYRPLCYRRIFNSVIHVFIYDFALGCRIEGKDFFAAALRWRRLLCLTFNVSNPGDLFNEY